MNLTHDDYEPEHGPESYSTVWRTLAVFWIAVGIIFGTLFGK